MSDSSSDRLLDHDEVLAAGQTPAVENSDVDLLRQLHGAWPVARAAHPDHLGRFRLIRLLGRGGCGVVYLAHDPRLGREVALKVPRPDALLSPEMRARFLREGQLAALLDHPNLVAVHEADEVGPICYLASAYVDGPTLAEWLSRQEGRRMEPRAAAELVATLAEAMHHAHQRGVIHRDLKPGNVLLAPLSSPLAGSPPHPEANPQAGRMAPKITDFGLARLLDDPDARTRTGALLGTPNYMAPEQAEGRGRDVSVATDVWALGCILHECLTGQPPFAADAPMATLQKILHAVPSPLRQGRPDAPRDLETIALKCLEKEPARRYDGAAALARDLRAWLAGRPIQARRHGAIERLTLWARREPRLAAVSALAVLSLLALPALVVWFSLRGGMLRREAEAERFYRLLSEMQARQLRREPGWSWDNLRDLSEAAAVPRAAEHQAELRSLAAACLGATDFRRETAIAEGFQPKQVLFSPDGRVLVLTPYSGGPEPLRVRLFDAKTLAELPGLTYPANPQWQAANNRAEGTESAAFSPNGRWLVVGTRSGRIHAFDLRARTEAESWQAHADGVTRLVFAPGGAELYSLDKGRNLARWAVGGKWPRLPLDGPPGNGVVDVTPVRPAGVLAMSGVPRLISAEGKHLINLSHVPPGVEALAAAPDNRTLVFHRQTGTEVIDLPFATPLALLPESTHCGPNDGMAFSPDGRLLARPSPSQSFVRVWDLASLSLKATFFVPGLTAGVSFFPDGRRLVVTTTDRAVVYERATADVKSAVAPQGGMVRDVAFSPDGSALACRAIQPLPRTWHEVSVWPVADDPLARPLHLTRLTPAPNVGNSVALGPSRRPALLFNWGEKLRVRDLTGLAYQEVGPFPRHGGLAFGPDGSAWAANHHDVQRSADAMQPLRSVWQNPLPDQQAGLTFYSVAVRRRWALAGRRDGRVFVFRAADGTLEASWPAGRSPVTALALSPDERSALVGGERGEVVLVAVPGGEILREFPAHVGPVTGGGFVGADLVVTGSRDRTLRVASTRGVRELTLAVEKPIERLVVSPDGARLAVVGENDRGVRTWRLDRLGQRLRELGLGGRLADLPATSEVKPPAAPSGKGNVVREVFGDQDFLWPIARRNDPNIDLRATNSGMVDPALGAIHNCLRWTGRLRAPETGEYHFELEHGHLSRLWINGKLLQPKAAGDPAPYTLRLASGRHAVRVDYGYPGGPARCVLRWRRPGAKAFEVVPPSAFVAE